MQFNGEREIPVRSLVTSAKRKLSRTDILSVLFLLQQISHIKNKKNKKKGIKRNGKNRIFN